MANDSKCDAKKLWLLPLILLMVLIGGLLVFVQVSMLAPFIYTFF